jgi:hypothetical protein
MIYSFVCYDNDIERGNKRGKREQHHGPFDLTIVSREKQYIYQAAVYILSSCV